MILNSIWGMGTMQPTAILICLVGSALFNLTPVSARAAPLGPNAHVSIGTLTATGDVTINTDTLTATVSRGRRTPESCGPRGQATLKSQYLRLMASMFPARPASRPSTRGPWRYVSQSDLLIGTDIVILPGTTQ